MIGMAEIIIAKHRNGATKTIKLRYRNEYTRFENIDAQEVKENFSPEEIMNSSNFVDRGSKLNSMLASNESFVSDGAVSYDPNSNIPPF